MVQLGDPIDFQLPMHSGVHPPLVIDVGEPGKVFFFLLVEVRQHGSSEQDTV